jgi:hypothetical protein
LLNVGLVNQSCYSKEKSQTLFTNTITTYPHGFKVAPYGSARIEIRHNYEERVGTEAEPFYLVAAFISCMVDEDQRSAFALLKDEERGER